MLWAKVVTNCITVETEVFSQIKMEKKQSILGYDKYDEHDKHQNQVLLKRL